MSFYFHCWQCQNVDWIQLCFLSLLIISKKMNRRVKPHPHRISYLYPVLTEKWELEVPAAAALVAKKTFAEWKMYGPCGWSDRHQKDEICPPLPVSYNIFHRHVSPEDDELHEKEDSQKKKKPKWFAVKNAATLWVWGCLKVNSFSSWSSCIIKDDMDSIYISWSAGVTLTLASLFLFYRLAGWHWPRIVRVGIAVIRQTGRNLLC